MIFRTQPWGAFMAGCPFRVIPPVRSWAEDNVRFPTTEACPRYVIEKSPYHRLLLDWWLDPEVFEILFIGPAQSGKSALLNLLVAYSIANDPSPMMLVSHDEALLKNYVKIRLKPMIAETFPGMVSESQRDGEWTKDGALVGGSFLWFAWASSENRCKSWPIAKVFGDELSAWKCDRQVALDRTKQFLLRRKALWVTTPDREDDQAWSCWRDSFQQWRYSYPCPHCGEGNVFEFKGTQFAEFRREDGTWNLDGVEHGAAYACEKCGAIIAPSQRAEMIRAGKPVCLTPERSARLRALRVHSLEVPAISWGETARTFLQSKDNLQALKTVVNQWFAEPYVPKRQGLRSRAVLSRVMDLDLGTVPRNAVSLGAGVDVQRGHVFVIVRAWLNDGRSILVWCGHIDERPPQPKEDDDEPMETRIVSLRRALARVYAEVLVRKWPWEGHPAPASIRFCAVDSGDGRTQAAVYSWAAEHAGIVYPAKGNPTGNFTVYRTDIEGLKGLWHVNTAHYRDYICESYQLAMGETGAWLVNRGTPEEYARHLESWRTVEVEVKDKAGDVKRRQREWRQIRTDDHYLDAEIYCCAVHDSRGFKPTPRKVHVEAVAGATANEGGWKIGR